MNQDNCTGEIKENYNDDGIESLHRFILTCTIVNRLGNNVNNYITLIVYINNISSPTDKNSF